MLQELHKSAGNWIVKIFLIVIALSFVAWGIGDIFRGRSETTAVAWVGDSEISGNTLRRTFQRELDRFEQVLRVRINTEQARSMGLVGQTLDSLVSQALFALEAERLGLGAGDDLVRQEIRAEFRNDAGNFDRLAYRWYLGEARMSEEQLVEMMRDDVVRRQLGGSLVAALSVPDILLDTLYRHRNEKRVVEFAVIENDAMKDIPEPREGELATFHEANAASYTAPEYRRLTYLHLAPEDLVDEISVAEEEIREEYDARHGSYVTPERRTVEQIVLGSKDEALKARAQLDDGVDFAQVAVAMTGIKADEISLGTVEFDDLFDPAIAKAVFGLEKGTVSAPTESGLGWHLLRVSEILPGRERKFEDVREELERELVMQKAAESLYPLSTVLDDTLSDGATFEEAAQQLGIRIATIAATDQSGRGPDGAEVEDLPTEPEFLEKAFELSEGGETIVVESKSDGTYFAVRVDEVTLPRLKPLDSIRDAVAGAWKELERGKKAAALGHELVERLDRGEKFAAIVGEHDLVMKLSTPFDRNGSGADRQFTQEFVGAVFDLDSGAATTASNPNLSGHVVARLKSVVAADPKDDEAGVAGTRQELVQALAVDIGTQYRTLLSARFPIEVDQEAVDNLFQYDP